MIKAFPYPEMAGIGSKSAIKLGRHVCCDGFVHGRNVRVQTHIHDDHMQGFSTSKGCSQIILTPATKALLELQYDADLPIRSNIKPLNPGEEYVYQDERVSFELSHHMLGGVQVSVTTSDGMRVGYSSDFAWPVTKPIQVDILIVDATYGDPSGIRAYRQEEIDVRFIDLATELLQGGPIVVLAPHRGSAQRAMELLTDRMRFPMLASRKLVAEIEIYRRYGRNIGAVFPVEDDEGTRIRASGEPFIYFSSRRDEVSENLGRRSFIYLSAFAIPVESPELRYDESCYRLAMTDHADFKETLDYISSTGAQYVLTDNSRGGDAEALAEAIKEHLGVPAWPAGAKGDPLDWKG